MDELKGSKCSKNFENLFWIICFKISKKANFIKIVFAFFFKFDRAGLIFTIIDCSFYFENNLRIHYVQVWNFIDHQQQRREHPQRQQWRG